MGWVDSAGMERRQERKRELRAETRGRASFPPAFVEMKRVWHDYSQDSAE